METLQVLLAVTDVIILGVFLRVHSYVMQTQTRLVIIETKLGLI